MTAGKSKLKSVTKGKVTKEGYSPRKQGFLTPFPPPNPTLSLGQIRGPPISQTWGLALAMELCLP